MAVKTARTRVIRRWRKNMDVLDDTEYVDMLNTLSEGSVRRNFNPYTDIDWDSPEFAVIPNDERWILPALNDPITSVRLQAIAASVSLGLRSALPDLTAMRSDEELWIRLRVEQAFDRLAPEQNAALPRDGAR